MIIVILMGLMVFFAVTPVDVVQFISYYIQEFKARAPPVRRKKPLMIPSCLAMKRRKNPLKT